MTAALLAFGCFATTTGCPGVGDGEPTPRFVLPDEPTWTDGVGQMLNAYCGECHGGQPADPSLAYFRTDTYADEGGRLGAYSLRLRHLARAQDPGRPMPPPPAQPMTPREVDGLRRWIDLGAPFDASGMGPQGVASCQPGQIGACACPGGWYGPQACLEDGTYEPCDCGGGGSVPVGEPPVDVVLSDVTTWVLQPSCSGGVGCHGPGGAPPDLSPDAGLWRRLLGSSVQAPGYRLIEPGDPERSYLFLKTRSDFVALRIGAGRQMPPPEAGALTPEQTGVLERWITAGAGE